MSDLVMVSGGYDPIHIGHIRQIKEASNYGKVIVVLNKDEWLVKKKGYIFMPYDERKEILQSIKYVSKVFPQIGHGNTMAESLRRYKPTVFCKGGDRNPDNMPKEELDVCDELGIRIVYGVGGDKIQSSSWLVDKFKEKIK